MKEPLFSTIDPAPPTTSVSAQKAVRGGGQKKSNPKELTRKPRVRRWVRPRCRVCFISASSPSLKEQKCTVVLSPLSFSAGGMPAACIWVQGTAVIRPGRGATRYCASPFTLHVLDDACLRCMDGWVDGWMIVCTVALRAFE